MDRPEDESKRATTSDEQRRTDRKADPTGGFDRRDFLKLTGTVAGVAASGAAAGSAAAAVTRNGISFDRVVDAVEDLGMDPTGSEPIDAAYESAMETGTLIEFPAGTYLVGSSHNTSSVGRFGIRGLGSHRQDVQFRPTEGSGLALFSGGGPGPYMIENLSFDERSDDTSMLYLGLGSNNGVYVGDVEWLGRTPLDDASDYTINADVYDQDAVAVYENVYAGLDEPAVPATYPDGVAFLRAGPAHAGEVIIRNPVIHERNSAATRLEAGPGVTTIEGGEFVNNQNANIRFGAGDHPSKVSSATGTYVKVDGSRDSADAVRLGAASSGYAGAVFEDLEIEWTKDSGRGIIALPDWGDHGRAEFRNCVIRNDGASTPTVNAQPVSIEDDTVIIENCAFTGQGGNFDATDRDGSVIRDSCIDMPNADIYGFETQNISTSQCRIPGGGDSGGDTNEGPTADIAVTGTDGLTVDLSGANSSDADGSIASYEWDVAGTAYTGQTVTHTFESGGTYTVGLTVTDDDGATGSTTTDVTVQDPNDGPVADITVTSVDDLTVDLSGANSSDADGSIASYEWDVAGTAYTGQTVTHTFASAGTYTVSLTVTDDDGATASTSVEVTVDNLNDLRIEGTGVTTQYDFTVTGQLQPVTDTIEEWDDVTESGATGWVTSTEDVDAFNFGGEIDSFQYLEGDANVYVNGELVQPAKKDLVIRGTGTPTEYDFTVSGDLDPVAKTIEGWDSVSESSANGWVTNTSHTDEFTFTGEFTRFEFPRGEAEVYVDGELVDVSSV